MYIAPKDRGEISKIGDFQNSRSIFKVFYQLNLPANNFHLIRGTTFTKTIFSFSLLYKSLFIEEFHVFHNLYKKDLIKIQTWFVSAGPNAHL